MKGLNKECQNMFLIAKGVDVTYSRSKLGWESFLSIYCLLKLNTATEKEYQDFIVKVFDPYNDKIVAKEQVEETLDAMFKGQFRLASDKGQKNGMSEDIKRNLQEKGVIND